MSVLAYGLITPLLSCKCLSLLNEVSHIDEKRLFLLNCTSLAMSLAEEYRVVASVIIT